MKNKAGWQNVSRFFLDFFLLFRYDGIIIISFLITGKRFIGMFFGTLYARNLNNGLSLITN
jgi:hypothetical protein